MSTASAIRAKAAAKYPAYPIDFEDGASIVLRSVMELSDNELKDFTQSSKDLSKADESDDVSELKTQFVETLAKVSDNPKMAASKLSGESLGFLTVVFTEYAEGLSAGSKS